MKNRNDEALDLVIDESETLIQTISSLRLLNESTRPHAESLDKSPIWLETMGEAIRTVPASKRQKFAATMSVALPFISAVTVKAVSITKKDDDPDDDWEVVSPEELVPKGLREILDVPSPSQDAETDADFEIVENEGRFRIRIEDDDIRSQFWRVIAKVEADSVTPNHVELLHRSLLIMAVSSFEVYVSSIYRAFLMCHYRAADDSETKRFSLSDLMALGTIEDAVDETIYQLGDSFSRKGIRAWAKWFDGKPLNIDVTTLALDWERTVEVFERRNAAVHNGSLVTRQYLANTPMGLFEDLEQGDPLWVDDEYLEKTFERLETLAASLAFQVRIRLFRRLDLEDAGQWLVEKQFDSLRAGRFETVVQLATSHSADINLQTSLLLRVNGWIASKRLGHFDASRKAIEAWDTSALTLTFQLAKAVLLDDKVDSLELLGKCVDAGDLDIQSLLTWPLLEDLRTDGSMDELIASHGVEVPDVLGVTDGGDPTSTES